MSTITLHAAAPDEIEALIPLLLDAEGSEAALRWGLAHLVDTVYAIDEDGVVKGAVTVQWRSGPCEIMELAIAPDARGRGLGRAALAWLADEAARRGYNKMLVGTANSSLGNLAFYQKCGFRMDHVRRDYFRYYRPPVYEHGLQIRDMLVFSRDLTPHQPGA
ncbi:MAG: GNAT family N-acetyltransferase [Herpetosiphon sp.]